MELVTKQLENYGKAVVMAAKTISSENTDISLKLALEAVKIGVMYNISDDLHEIAKRCDLERVTESLDYIGNRLEDLDVTLS